MKKPELLILANHPPLDVMRPASGLAVRHAHMAQILAQQGFKVCYAWPSQASEPFEPTPWPGVSALPLSDPGVLSRWFASRKSSEPGCVVLGYWQLADWLEASLSWPVALDYIAPRWVEKHFEAPYALPLELDVLLTVLAQCDEVWVGNARQRDSLLPLMMMAGHDFRHAEPLRCVAISHPLVDSGPALAQQSDALRLLAAGQLWPWRKQQRWLDAIRAMPPEQVNLREIGSEGRLLAHADYQALLGASDIVLELADENAERRLSQSFRMSDALCRGVPVICNRYLDLAEAVRDYGAGWLVDEPQQLPALMEQLLADRKQVDAARRGAQTLARDLLDADRVYAGLGESLSDLARRGRCAPGKPMASFRQETGANGWRHALSEYRRGWVEHRIRKPLQRFWQRLASERPKPAEGREAWVVLSRPDIFPVNHGAAVKIERTAWGLSHHVDEVLLLTDNRREYRVYRQGQCDVRRFPFWLRCLGLPRKINLLRLLARGLPLSNAFLYLPLADRSLQLRLLWLLRRHPVSVVQGEFPAYASPAVWSGRLFGTRSLMVEHNVEFSRIAEQVEGVTQRQVGVLRDIEITLANACDRVVTVSQPDRDRLIEHGVQPGRITTIPHGVDLQRFTHSPSVDLRARYAIPGDHAVLVYHGIYSYQPNADAVRELATQLLPALAKRGIAASVVAIGPKPLQEKLPGVVFAGAVEDLAGHLKGGDLAVIPLRHGGGTRMKILDDFAARVPVVSTSKGMEGIEVRHGDQIWVVDDADQMADDVAELLRDEPRRQTLAQSAWQWVQALDWRHIAGRYVEMMRSID